MGKPDQFKSDCLGPVRSQDFLKMKCVGASDGKRISGGTAPPDIIFKIRMHFDSGPLEPALSLFLFGSQNSFRDT